jgi:hypothetical protein
LLEKGAIDLPDEQGDHALDHAVTICHEKENEGMIELLQQAELKKMKLRSRLSMKCSRSHNRALGLVLGLVELWALCRALS